MRLSPVAEGTRFAILALDLSGDPSVEDCPAKDFIDGLSPGSKRSMVLLLERHANYGPIKNESKSRELEDGIFEFKTHHGGGERLFYFYAEGGKTILTHGAGKQPNKRLKGEIRRAKELRAQWRAANDE
jgi:putative component of toxin-antitoxin plasmid stabilization module